MIVNLNNVGQRDIIEVGGKALNLGKLIQNDFPVPEGFVLTTEAYSTFLKSNNLTDFITNELSNIDYTNYTSIEKSAKKVQEAIKNSIFSQGLVEKIKQAYDKLYTTIVAVRSSATAEDLLTASFAGQYDTFLNLKTLGQVIKNIKSCYASIWTSRAIAYRHENKIPHSDVMLAVLKK